MDHFDEFLDDDAGFNELNFGLKPRAKLKLKLPATFPVKKSTTQPATTPADEKPTSTPTILPAEKKSELQPATVAVEKKSELQLATTSADIETFKREFAAEDNHVFFMLHDIKPAAPGIEHSAFRRCKLFANRLGVKVTFVTNIYQNDLLEQLAAYNVDTPVLNMYDYFQEINRAVEKPRKTYVEPMHEGWKIERLEKDWRILRRDDTLVMYCGFFGNDNRRLSYINFFNDSHKKIRRDYYDALGFLSCRQELDDKERPQEVFYYRPDGTLAAHEFYELIKNKNTVTLMELIDRDGNVTNVFKSHDEAISHWLLKIFGKTKNYFLVGDRKPEYNQTYINLLAGGYDNVRVIQQVHNIHVVMGKPGEIPNPHKDSTVVYCTFLNDRRIKSDAIITLTEKQQADIAQRYKFDNVTAIPHALDDTLTIPAVKVDPFKIVQVGRIVEEKGQAQAVEVMRQVVKKIPQATLHFYGKGSLQSTIQKIIDAHNLSKHIKFEGFSKNMPEVFASAALSILPSRLEGFALVVQESLQAGTPVVAFDCSYGPSDMIQDGVNGFLVPVNDTKAMADRIIRILTEAGLRQKLSSNCAQSIEKFSPQEVAGKWAKLFLKLMKQGQGSESGISILTPNS
ncbi:MAG: glycosyltransferase [Selenomonadaceae bacterium]|nr:glycosyltransferase [Selenomonadaceae bacterium]